jgi:hypothetical protein
MASTVFFLPFYILNFAEFEKPGFFRISDNAELAWISPDAWPTDSNEPFHLEGQYF